ncbi:hypothetical protein V6N11_067906 [Hibiscus sabdariffa]|uniref:alpha-amylase n=1 Tax=Hibiscus sabdariffa TaxID=183260 RepID=A0ABR2SS60_9ROSI
MVMLAKAERDVYVAIIDDKVAMKIGPSYYEPPNGRRRWSSTLEGYDYKLSLGEYFLVNSPRLLRKR